MDTSKIIINGSRILVKEKVLTNETDSGIYVAGRDKENTCQGTVLLVGDGAMLEDGTKVPVNVKVGETVLYTEYSGSPIVMVGEEEKDTKYIILNERDILCRIVDWYCHIGEVALCHFPFLLIRRY